MSDTSGFFSILEKYPPFLELKEKLRSTKPNIISVTGLTDGSKAHLMTALILSENRPAFLMAKNRKECEKAKQFAQFYGVPVYVLPEYEFCYYELDARDSFSKKERLDFLYALSKKERALYVVTPNAFFVPVPKRELMENSSLVLKIGDELEQNAFLSGLRSYERVDVVESQGQFSVRGGIVDVFPYTSGVPYRIEFFGDEIDSIRTFDPITRLSYEVVMEAEITSAEEMQAVNPKLLAKRLEQEEKDAVGELKLILQRDIERLETRGKLTSYDRYFPFLSDVLSPLSSYLDEEFICVLDDPYAIYEAHEALYKEHLDYLTDLCEKELIHKSNLSFFSEPKTQMEAIYGNSVLHLSFIKSNYGEKLATAEINFPSQAALSVSGSIGIFVEELKGYLDAGYCVLIPGKSRSKAEKLSYTLSNYDISAPVVEAFSYVPKEVQILPVPGFTEGFSYPELKFVYFSDIYTSDNTRRKPKAIKNENAITNFSDLSVGDYVVHPVHGIGEYLGITRLTVEDEAKDFIKIRYQGSDYLYIPVNQLNTLYKYVGNESKTVKLNKLGGVDFDRVKQRVKKSCQDLALKLMELYKKRELAEGYAYSPDSDMQIQFERTFPYEETEDQLNSIYEVKKDMESPRPMDRLLCGDVGYGKTEIALRAAFKAVCDGKQVAYLAPTTVLAQQHYNTFCERMKEFPVTVGLLSRFRTKKQIDKVLKESKEGLCDIIIGTHRLLSDDVKFKDLGLLIVDEEQRFGVAHKEKIKEMKNGVDILTLSATPIPRTLNMAMVGIRDVSTLKEPPCDRHPVRTYVLEYNQAIIFEAIHKELNRKGQIFYLHNRVDSIYSVAAKLKEAFPDTVVEVAHGKLGREKMEEIFYRMSIGEVDILVCTTIIETGLDIPNVNTIVVEQADHLGLAQLYQIRGRVGRSNRLAYCYLTYQRDKSITEVSEKRLKAIKEFTEFGSGFKIALRDLEIRGAGNILGAEQHGHMDAVGYDMYLKLLDEAVREQKGETITPEVTCQVDLKVSAFLDDAYISDHATKLEIYKKISLIRTREDMEDMVDELTDRFSDVPSETMNLIEISYLRVMCEGFGIYDVSEARGVVTFRLNQLSQEMISAVLNIGSQYKGKALFGAGAKPYFSIRTVTLRKTRELVEILENIRKQLQSKTEV
ncbi:MAG: transcription-repair coupling factor [Clostridia bacterium]|nr:transcription-repair coupling factor [Clostridia bacterium]